MKKIILLSLGLGALSGCSTLQSLNPFAEDDAPKVSAHKKQVIAPVNMGLTPMKESASDDEDGQELASSAANTVQIDNFGSASGGVLGQPRYANRQGGYQGQTSGKHVGDYVQNLTQDLVSNMEYITDSTAVGVSHFALLDGDLQKTNLLGFQLAESFMHELHKFRIPVIDYKATQYVRVTEQGDFILTRDFLELSESSPIEYILTGTLTKHQSGFLVNARILGLQSKAVVASAQTLIPFHIVEALMPSEFNVRDGIKLMQGE